MKKPIRYIFEWRKRRKFKKWLKEEMRKDYDRRLYEDILSGGDGFSVDRWATMTADQVQKDFLMTVEAIETIGKNKTGWEFNHCTLIAEDFRRPGILLVYCECGWYEDASTKDQLYNAEHVAEQYRRHMKFWRDCNGQTYVSES